MLGEQGLFLVGPMGAGKSTIGRALARELNADFFDSDKEIEQRAGADIPWIYDLEGEEGFRAREQKVIDDLTQRPSIVLATGGSVVANPACCKMIANRGYVLYLYASVEQQLQRIKRERESTHDHRRPLLEQSDDLNQMLQDMQAERDPIYQSIANSKFSTEKRSIRAVVAEIIQHLQGCGQI